MIAYTSVLMGALAVSLAVSLPRVQVGGEIEAWVVLTVLLGFSEYRSLFFHGRGARVSLSSSEAILLPMLVVLSFPEVVIGATLANAIGRFPRWRVAPTKEIFNVAQYGCATAAAAALWNFLRGTEQRFEATEALVVIAAVFVFALLTHTFVALAVSIAEKKSFLQLSRSVAPATVLNLAGSVTVGLLFTAAYLQASWTLALLPVFIGGLHLAYEAVHRQAGERQRVEQIHAATRALASSPELSHAVEDFLKAAAEIASASEARLVVETNHGYRWSAVRSGAVVSSFGDLEPGVMTDLVRRLDESHVPVVVGEDESGPLRQLANGIGARNLLAVPVQDKDRMVGVLIVIDRLGINDFDKADMRLLEALANELVLALDSYRLFAEVTEERERFQRIFQGSKEGICLIDTDGLVKAWNPALEKITGYGEPDIIGRRCSDTVLVRDSAQRRVEIEELIAASPEAQFELVTRQGPPRWISVQSGPIETGGERGWVVLVRDRTAEHDAEEAKSDFLSTISHELRTPLTTIKGALQVLGRDPSRLPPDTAEQMIQVLRRGSDRLERLVLNLLFVSQVETGGVELISDEFGLSELVPDVLSRVIEDRARVRLVLPDEDPVVRADREKLAHALEHLLDNAQKYGEPTGAIVVEVAREDGYARVSVTDNGPGIPKADQERIFERFVRLGDILTREQQGAGVGLFVARRSIEDMGGSIWVDSEGGKGATFHMRIPLAHPVPVADEATGA